MARFIDRSKERPLVDAAGLLPFIDRRLHQNGNRNGPDVSGLAQQVGDDSVLLSQLDRLHLQRQ
jgi:hypothetical protein